MTTRELRLFIVPLPRANFGGNCVGRKTESSNGLRRFPNFFIDLWPEAINPSEYPQGGASYDVPNPSIGTARHGSKADALIPRTEWTKALHC